MTLFRVQCQTCSARLKVNSRSLIGQIVNCPKCGSMLEIADPDSAPAPSEKKAKAVAPVAPVVKPEPTSPAEAPPEAVTSPESSPEPEVPASDAAATSSDGAFDQLDEMLDDAPAEDAAVATTSEAASATTPPIESGRFADSASVGKWRNVALIGGTAVMAVTTFAIIGYAVFSGSNASPTPAPEEVEPTQVAQFEPPEEETKPAEEETQPVEAEPQPQEEPALDPMPTPMETEQTPEASPSTPTEETPNNPGAEEPGEPVIPSDDNPFLFDDPMNDATTPKPENMPEAGPSETVPAEPAVAENDNSVLQLKDDPLYEVFGESFPIFNPEDFENSANTNPAPANAADPAPKIEVASAPQLVPPIANVDVAQRLRDPIVKIEFQKMPLNQFASFVTQMSTVPITLDPIALASADINAATPITVNQTQTSIEGILQNAVRPFGLDIQATENSARLQITQPLDGHKRVARLLVDDLAQDQKQVADIAYLLTHVVEPLSWKQTRGDGLYRIDPGAIMITQSEVAHFKAVVFLEKLRIARGLPQRSQFSPQLFDLTHRTDQLRPALQRDVKLQIVVPTPLYKVIDQLEKKSGLTILCDWDSLALNKLGPATPVTLTAPNISAEQALSEFCKAWKLEALPINASTVQLVSQRSVPIMPWLEFYDVSSLELGKSEAAALINDAKRELSDLRKTGYGDIQYDPVSKRLLALLSKDDHQRLKFALQRKVSN